MSLRRSPLELGPRPRGVCAQCGLWFAIKRDGTLRKHEAQLLDVYHHVRMGVCPGSGQAPDRILPPEIGGG